jgi:hypothetical protein
MASSVVHYYSYKLQDEKSEPILLSVGVYKNCSPVLGINGFYKVDKILSQDGKISYTKIIPHTQLFAPSDTINIDSKTQVHVDWPDACAPPSVYQKTDKDDKITLPVEGQVTPKEHTCQELDTILKRTGGNISFDASNECLKLVEKKNNIEKSNRKMMWVWILMAISILILLGAGLWWYFS